MINILITGANSYIGTSVENWLNKWPDKYKIDTLDMKDDSWRNKSFSKYDVVYHVAGIVHIKEKTNMKEIYDKVNHRLAVEILEKSASHGVKQFIFMSSGAVFSQNDKKHKDISIMPNTNYEPLTMYGKSKRLAEENMMKLIEKNKLENIKIAIIRPPMIYGKGAKGNYNTLAKLARKLTFFPEVKNKRSMIYIDNLCEFIRLLIDTQDTGVFHPQNREFVNTTDLVLCIAKVHNKKIIKTKIFNLIIKFSGRFFSPINKAFGSFIYEKCISNHYDWKYCVVDFEESIRNTEL